MLASLPSRVQICNFKRDATDCDRQTKKITGFINRIGKDSPSGIDPEATSDEYTVGNQLQDKAGGVDKNFRLAAGALFGVQIEQALILEPLTESELVENGTPLNQHGSIEVYSQVTLADTTAYDHSAGVIPTLVRRVPVDA